MSKINKDDWKERILGGNKNPTPFQKLEPEFVPKWGMLGLGDDDEREELINVMSKAGVKRVNFCYPLDEDLSQSPELIIYTMDMARSFKDSGFLVSFCNIDELGKIKVIKKEFGNLDDISYLTDDSWVPAVMEYCTKHNTPFIPSGHNIAEMKAYVDAGYPVVKAMPYAQQKVVDGKAEGMFAVPELRQKINGRKVDQEQSDVLFAAGGGLAPLFTKPVGGAPKLNWAFKDAAKLEGMVIISATQPVKVCLLENGCSWTSGSESAVIANRLDGTQSYLKTKPSLKRTETYFNAVKTKLEGKEKVKPAGSAPLNQRTP
ncbi:MAG: hypothetical protein FWE53_00325 [Firmicutes bacterium]|nr:hypothetical protein [Bacillota bacterium]